MFNLDDKCTMTFDKETTVEVSTLDLKKIEVLGIGSYGIVEKMVHSGTGRIIAVKRIHSISTDQNQKQMVVELDTLMKSECCPQMVQFFGAMYREGDVWICMEVMDTSLDKFYKICVDQKANLPEIFVAKVASAIVEGLHFMKEKMNLMHRDVKPSNILLNKKGDVKICDFGISGHLTESVAKTVQAGCKPYMAPERIQDGDSKSAYDVRADVWSLGISCVEICNGYHPYSQWRTPFQQLKQVVDEPAPLILKSLGYSDDLHDFVRLCLTKNYKDRPKYGVLLIHPFIEIAKTSELDMGDYITKTLENIEEPLKKLLSANHNINI
uniref:Protein kinase domain-containing protein n=1 Tax=Rhabditophanes sp. KR3021 TaxID=114890 RepID=A0AC35TV94_9BILA